MIFLCLGTSSVFSTLWHVLPGVHTDRVWRREDRFYAQQVLRKTRVVSSLNQEGSLAYQTQRLSCTDDRYSLSCKFRSRGHCMVLVVPGGTTRFRHADDVYSVSATGCVTSVMFVKGTC